MTDVIALLQEFAREKLASLLRHQAGARLVAQYDANNAYQYIINRDETEFDDIADLVVRQDIGAVLEPFIAT